MKKYLYATTAIIGVTAVATGANAQGLELNVGGFSNTYYGIADYSDVGNRDDTREIAFQEVELRLTGGVTLDNGVEVGAFLSNEIEGDTAEADEQYVYMAGSFGTLQLGAQNGAAYQLNAGGSQAYAAGTPVNSGWGVIQDLTGDYAGNFRTPAVSTFLDLTNDGNGVVYKSPRVAGFQLGGSWHPKSEGTNPAAQTDFFSQVDDGPNGDENNAISVGLNFSRDFQGVGIDASAGYGTEDRPGEDDPNQYQFSLGASVAGFSFGGAVGIQDGGTRSSTSGGVDLNDNGSFEDTINLGGGASFTEPTPTTTTSSLDGESYALGAAYTIGPWTAGVNGIYSEVEGNTANPDEDKRLAIQGGLDYAMGPGITLSSGLAYVDFDNEEGTDPEGIAGTLGASVSF